MKVTRKDFLRTAGGLAIAGGAGWAIPAPFLSAARYEGARARQTVASVEIAPFSIPQIEVVKIALAAPVTADSVIVRLRTTGGVVGYGEASPYSPVTGETQASDLAMAELLAPLVRGRDPFTLPRIVEDMDAIAPETPAIKAAIEMALWDICGKIVGQPVYRLLGAYRDSFETDQTIYYGSPEEVAAKAEDMVRRGFRNIKLKLGETLPTDLEKMRAVRAAAGPSVTVRGDANQAWSVPDAIRTLRALEPLGLEFCEQPVPRWDWAGMRRVRQSAPIPIMADESVSSAHDVLLGFREDAMDMVNIKLMKAGGILRAIQVANIAAAANLPCMMGCMSESRLALTAAAHAVMSLPIVRYADLDTFLEHKIDIVSGGMQVRNGVVSLPDTPGLGLELDPAVLRRLQPVV